MSINKTMKDQKDPKAGKGGQIPLEPDIDEDEQDRVKHAEKDYQAHMKNMRRDANEARGRFGKSPHGKALERIAADVLAEAPGAGTEAAKVGPQLSFEDREALAGVVAEVADRHRNMAGLASFTDDQLRAELSRREAAAKTVKPWYDKLEKGTAA